MTAEASGALPDATYCQTVQAEYGLTMPVLFDPDGVSNTVLGMPANSGELVLTEGNIIESKTQGAHAAVAATLEGVYGF